MGDLKIEDSNFKSSAFKKKITLNLVSSIKNAKLVTPIVTCLIFLM